MLALICPQIGRAQVGAWLEGEADGEVQALARGAGVSVPPSRLVHRFDFEETDDRGRKLGLGQPLPQHWYVIGRSPQTADPNFRQRPLHQELIRRSGFPAYTQVRFDRQHKSSGDFSFYLGLDGGSAGAYLETGTLPAVPGSDYLVTARVFTTRLRHAAAYLRAYFIDAQGRRIEASVSQTEPIRTSGGWADVSVKLDGIHREAAWIGMEVLLQQPQPLPHHPLGNEQIVLQDIDAAAWFDDICVWQVPHVEVGSQSPVNIIHEPDHPRFVASVRDLANHHLLATLTLYDHRLRPVATSTHPLGDGAPTRWIWEPPLPGLGWYLIDLQVSDQQQAGQPGSPQAVMARTVSAVLWLPQASSLHPLDAGRFSLTAQGLPDDELRLLPDLLTAARIYHATISAWSPSTTLLNLEDRLNLLGELVQRTITTGHELAISLDPLPSELIQSRPVPEAVEPLEVLQAQPQTWEPYLRPILMRFGQQIQQWQLGDNQRARAFYSPDLPAQVARARERFLAMTPQPRLILPWRLDQARRPDLNEQGITFSLDVPPAITAQRLQDHLKEWDNPPADYWLHLREPPADVLAHPQRAIDLAMRMIHAWQTDADRLTLPRPWTTGPARRINLIPDPLLGVFTNVAHLLAGRRVVGELALGQGLRCLILDGPAGGMLIAWNHSATPQRAAVQLYLGETPVAVDIWGNRQPIDLSEEGHRLELSPSPTFVTGIDPQLALFRAGFQLNEPFIVSTQETHKRQITLTNPWQRTISGNLVVTGPQGWQIQPARQFFSIAAGKTTTLPLEIRFPIVEVAGPKELTARFDFTADRRYVVNMSTPMEVGLPDFHFDAILSLKEGKQPDAQDVIVSCVITNESDRAASLYVFASLVGHARQERIVSRLEPGQAVVRRFYFEAASKQLQQYPLRTGIRETNGPAILNKLLTLENAGIPSR